MLELVSVGINLELARIVMALQRDDMGDGTNSAIFVLPRRRRDTRDTILDRKSVV